MRGAAFISTLAAGLLSLSAEARVSVPECSVQTAEQVFELEAFDLGNGMTAFLENKGPDGPDVGTTLVVISCHTGRYVEATVYKGPEGKRREYPAALDIFEAAAEPDAIVTFEQLATRFDTEKVPTVYGISRNETCACALAYPGLRGTKLGYQDQ